MAYDIRIEKDILYREGGKPCGADSQTLDLYLPVGAARCPVLVFFHGGGFLHYYWTKENYVEYCTELAKEGIAVAAPNYRLYPEFEGFPQAPDPAFCDDPDGIFRGFLDDSACAMAWVRDHLADYVPFNGRMFLGGHSAGAWLSMMILFDESVLEPYGMQPSQLAGCIFASGQPTSHFSVLFARGRDPRLTLIDDAAPMYYLKSLPVPQLVTLAETDLTNRDLQTQLYLASLKTIGYEGSVQFIEYKGYTHDNYVCPDADAPEIPVAMHADTVAFIQKYSK
ncbi:MAG: alpha/beta hydrolase [Firmicutes bacterium]|nr:alpha/beta hydrolase [Bacillota bacterium]